MRTTSFFLFLGEICIVVLISAKIRVFLPARSNSSHISASITLMSRVSLTSEQVNTLVLNRNKEAMDQLRANRHKAAMRLLREAQQILDDSSDPTGKLKLLAITYNNLGCYYKRTSQPLYALKYLHQALELEAKPPVDYTNLAGTHLNICAIRSLLGKHETALQEALKALDILAQSPEITPNSATTQSIAYHNAGIELEHLSRLSEALDMFKVGWEFSKHELGETHPLAESLCRAYYHLLEERIDGKSSREALYPSKKGHGHRAGIAATFRHFSPQSRSRGRRGVKSRTLENPLSSLLPSPERYRANRSLIGGDVRFITGERKRPMFKMAFKVSPKPASPLRKGLNPAPSPGLIRKVFHKQGAKEGNAPKGLEHKVKALGSELGKLMKRVDDMEGQRKSRTSTLPGSPKAASVPPRPAPKKDLKTTLFPAPSKPSPVPLQPSHLLRCQSCLRGYLERAKVRKQVLAAVVIQKEVRKYQCYWLYRNIRAAIRCIQAWWRRIRMRRRKAKRPAKGKARKRAN